MKKCICAAAFLMVGLWAAAQESSGMKKVILFEGKTIREIELSGDFEVIIRQGRPTGVTLEVPQNIPVDTLPSYGGKRVFGKDGLLNRKEGIRDTVRCVLAGETLRLTNLRPVISGQQGRGLSLTWEAGPRAKAVITVGDLRKLQAYSTGVLRLDGKVRLAVAHISVGKGMFMVGENLSVAEMLSVAAFDGGKLEGNISGTPRVNVQAFDNGQVDLTVDSVGCLDARAFDHGVVGLRGRVGTFVKSVFNRGILKIRDLKVEKHAEREKSERK